MRKMQRRWWMVTKVLTKMGATVRARSMMYKKVVQKLLLYRSDSWLAMEAMLNIIEGFHHRLARRISGISDWGVGEGGRSGHLWWRPWRQRSCGQGRSTFWGSRLPLRHISQINQYMNCEWGRRGFRD